MGYCMKRLYAHPRENITKVAKDKGEDEKTLENDHSFTMQSVGKAIFLSSNYFKVSIKCPRNFPTNFKCAHAAPKRHRMCGVVQNGLV
jgi:hypothetical protein